MRDIERIFMDGFEGDRACANKECGAITDEMVYCSECGDICMECADYGSDSYIICSGCNRDTVGCDCYDDPEELVENLVSKELCHRCAGKFGLLD